MLAGTDILFDKNFLHLNIPRGRVSLTNSRVNKRHSTVKQYRVIDGLPLVEVKVGYMSCTALFDSGAQYSILSEDHFHNFESQVELFDTQEIIVPGGMSALKPIYKCAIPVNIGGFDVGVVTRMMIESLASVEDTVREKVGFKIGADLISKHEWLIGRNELIKL